ncbi:hypothetical protein [Bacillus phage Megatron]|uniref:Uncharacterized protein n=2 Tax=Wphvirus megatron TaxID=1987728 RepID=A0A024B2Z3_9CAUD|nr:hypothetical protein FP75_gp170 [Bacillus phage Megatron]AHZ10752.1 hypothetical protein [Bacillus phage Megatron]ANI24788.1 hypothetical protein SMUDGE_169 [Bacillus phage Smudge]
MSTYDGAYQSSRGTVDKGAWNCICTCEEGELSKFCDKCNYNWDGTPKTVIELRALEFRREMTKQ